MIPSRTPEARRAYYLRHREHIKAKSAARYRNNRKRCLAQMAEYYARNAEKKRQEERERRQAASPEQRRRQRQLQKRRQETERKELKDSYVKAVLYRRGWTYASMTTEIVQLMRLILEAKRIVHT